MENGKSVAENADFMNAEKYQKIKKIFHQAADMSLMERQDFVAVSCEEDSEMRCEIEKMFVFADAEATTDVLEKNAFEIFTGSDSGKIHEQIGGYKILREIGRGGMGVVYEAVRETENFTQRAALKVIKRGMDTDAIVRRFRVEQKILASLEHPFIARFLDGGMTGEGLPFYAMEYVEGESIDNYCREKNISVEEKLKLFRKVCAALQYAHQNLVVHRDLKPKNILVTRDGTPKLLDFGIGKILTPEAGDEIGTATQFGMMTPAYASPEQVRGQRIGTTSDIYSLGVILFELLTGQTPYKLTSQSQIEIQRVILENEPEKPSAIVSKKFKDKSSTSDGNSKFKIQDSKLLKGDLDNIILKSLQKNPLDRYASVGQFSADLQRFMDGLPVTARPATFSYRASKFLRRNKAPVLASAFIFLALLAGIIVALWQAQIARAERERAERRFNEVRELANNVIFKYHDAIAALPGSTATREMLVTDALKYLDNLSKETEGNTELQRELASAYFKLGDVQGKQYEANIGDTAGAAESYKKAAILLERSIEKDKNNLEAKLELVRIYEALFAAYMRFGAAEEKRTVLSKAINLQDELTTAEPENTKFQLQKIQLLLRKADATGGLQNTLNANLETLNIAENLLRTTGESDELNKTLARLYQRIGTLYILLGDEAVKKANSPAEFYREALPFHEKSLVFAEKNYAADWNNQPNRRRYAVALINLSETSAKNGLKEEAKMQSAIRLMQKTADEDSRNLEAKFDLAEANRVQAEIREKFGEIYKAIENVRTALALYQIIWQTDKKNLESRNAIIDAHRKLAELYELSNQNQQAAFHRQEFENIKIGN